MGDNYKRAKTAHTSYRLPDAVKNKLSELAEMDGLTKTETLKRLINADYKARLEEVKIFRENRKIEQS